MLDGKTTALLKGVVFCTGSSGISSGSHDRSSNGSSSLVVDRNLSSGMKVDA